MKLLIKKLLVFFFARQGLSGPYQIRSSSSSDMDLIILVLRKKILIINMYQEHLTVGRTLTYMMLVSFYSNMMGVTRGAGTANLFGAPEFTPAFCCCWVLVVQSLVFCALQIIVCPFPFNLYIVCPSSIYSF